MGQELRSFANKPGLRLSVAFSPDGKRLAATSTVEYRGVVRL
jgi:hypothetical protein